MCKLSFKERILEKMAIAKVAIIVALAFLLDVTPLQAAEHEAALRKPNIVFMMSDDMGYETMSYNGAVNFSTPNMDQLARESYVFTQCDAMPLCCPTRTRVMTGQYNFRNYKGWNGRFIKTAPSMAEMLKSAGYRTGAFGKWHLGGEGSEKRLGIDDACLFTPGTPKVLLNTAYYGASYRHNGKNEVAEYGPDLANKYALEFIEENKDQPFFLYYTPWLSHNPFNPTPDSKDPNSTDWQSNFQDMVAYSDKLFGKVVQKLKDLGIYENTIIVYTSDNGTKVCTHQMKDGSKIYGRKGTHTVDGCRVPLFIKMDGKHKTVDHLVDFTDFYPTFASLAGVSPESLSDEVDGIDFSSALKGESKKIRPYIFSHYKSSVYVRNQQYKYYIDQRLYDIAADPRELHPFYPVNDSEATAEARKQLRGYLDEVLADPRHANSQHKTKVQALRNKYSGDLNRWLVETRQFEDLSKEPKLDQWKMDVTPYVSKGKGSYQLSFMRQKNQYGQIRITNVALKCDGKEVFNDQPKQAILTSSLPGGDLHPLDINAFKHSERNNQISLSGFSIPEGVKKVELTVDVELSDPGHQWGDRVILYTYLKNASGVPMRRK